MTTSVPLMHDRYTKAAPTVKSDDDLLKGVRKYARTARKAWEAMSIPEDQNIDFEGGICVRTTAAQLRCARSDVWRRTMFGIVIFGVDAEHRRGY